MKNKQKQYSKIYDEHVERIYRFICLKVGSVEMAEDITSQVFIKCWKRFKDGLKFDNESAYLFKVARAEVANHYRKNSKYKIISTSSAQEIPSPAKSPEEEEEIKWQVNKAQGLLAKLKEEYQDILILRYIDGYDIDEIALMLNKTEANVRVMAHRALKALRELMENER